VNRAERLAKVAPGASDEMIAALADRPAAEVDAIVALARQAGRDAVDADTAKRKARRDGRRRGDESQQTAAMLRLVDATGRRAQGSPEALAGLAAFARAVNLVMGLAVDGLRRRGYHDSDIAEILGVSQQAVSKRWKREPGDGEDAQTGHASIRP
jgi:hypothetical protein